MLRPAYMAKCLGACFKAASSVDPETNPDGAALHPQHIYFLMDGFCAQHEKDINNVFCGGDRKLERVDKCVYVTYEESSLALRRRR